MCKWLFLQVYATVNSEDQHNFLGRIGIQFITSSHNGSKFSEDIKVPDVCMRHFYS